ncbi:SNARE motif protein [Catovirus CTV1]|uniref:SNARE motif protein n=1 Tax=Catovirus CTV1 TaxID=1977631 RepID=A0A1V0SA55_9VIRU|nr:SNARE motif protein [Catovirus CTV1]
MDPREHIKNIKTKIGNVKNTMIENIDSILSRGDKLEEISLKTENLADAGKEFKKNSVQTRRLMCAKSCILLTILLLIMLCVILTVAIIITITVIIVKQKIE